MKWTWTQDPGPFFLFLLINIMWTEKSLFMILHVYDRHTIVYGQMPPYGYI